MNHGPIKLSKKAKDQLTQLTRHTGIEHRNVLCRWALCMGEWSTEPGRNPDTALHIEWDTFCGSHHSTIEALYRLGLVNTAPTDAANATSKAIESALGHFHSVRSIAALTALAVHPLRRPNSRS
jgi:DNA sulfur modification protein DndE